MILNQSLSESSDSEELEGDDDESFVGLALVAGVLVGLPTFLGVACKATILSYKKI